MLNIIWRYIWKMSSNMKKMRSNMKKRRSNMKKRAEIWKNGRKFEKKTCAKEGKYTNSEKSQQYEVYKLKFWKINQAWNSEKSMIMWIPWIHNETDGSELWTLYYIWIHYGVKIEVTRKSCLLNTLPFMLSLFFGRTIELNWKQMFRKNVILL